MCFDNDENLQRMKEALLEIIYDFEMKMYKKNEKLLKKINRINDNN